MGLLRFSVSPELFCLTLYGNGQVLQVMHDQCGCVYVQVTVRVVLWLLLLGFSLLARRLMLLNLERRSGGHFLVGVGHDERVIE